MTVYTEGFSRLTPCATAPIATGWSDSCRVGFAPTGRPCLCTAHHEIVFTGFASEPLNLEIWVVTCKVTGLGDGQIEGEFQLAIRRQRGRGRRRDGLKAEKISCPVATHGIQTARHVRESRHSPSHERPLWRCPLWRCLIEGERVHAVAAAFRIGRTIDAGDVERELIHCWAESGFKQGVRYTVSNQ